MSKSKKKRTNNKKSHKSKKENNSNSEKKAKEVKDIPSEIENLDEKKIFIQNIPQNYSRDQLIGYLSEIGEIENIGYFEENGQAIVEYKTLKSNPLRYNRSHIEDNQISIRYMNKNDLKVRIYHVPESLSQEGLKEYIQEAGEVESMVNEKLVWIVSFKNANDIEEILKYNGADIEGVPIKILWIGGKE